MKNNLVLIAAGGTGGHVFPGLALAEQLQSRSYEVQWLGTQAGLESRLVPVRGIKLNLFAVSGLRGKGLLAWLMAPLKLLISLYCALRILLKIKPAVVVGMGGFVAGPAGLAARLLGIPLLIHEQNAVAGSTNKILSKFASCALQAFPGALTGAEVVGNPLRASLEVLHNRSDYSADKLKLTVMGGSRGARALNTRLPAALREAGVSEWLDIWHQSGVGRRDEAEQAYAAAGIKATVVEFIDDMDALLDCTELMVCRAGALTVSEVASVGIPALFVPYPYAIDDHQSANAHFLTDAGAALMVQEKDFDSGALVAALKDFCSDRNKLRHMAKLSADSALRGAAEKVADAVEELSA
ncbi:undecaprenyldiphospho-muramoylpentapeptide beta-N-acetylglucosaminyltransferase [Agaribacterium haliotis]|uniref:undecaprenyldiphospho-muramoylpentapeptide beta-N-acetylglucosaminyltransferase n=1 Tax=Agaribacterium haliotis TaxID=2013869 RepID=UPI000BB57FC7|nr:undecaprenyldiphospho-muramoylpentapeptide beta-N-acetylglucosaminyltransferase [Agaribacterium haliotis]